MATVSTTFSQFRDSVVKTHTGLIATGGAYSNSTTICPSGILLLCKLPDGATILDYWLKISARGAAANSVEIGTSNTNSGIMALTALSFTMSTSASAQPVLPTQYGVWNQAWLRAPGIADELPVRISLTGSTQETVWAQLRISAEVTGSAYFTFMCFYTMDGIRGHSTIR